MEPDPTALTFAALVTAPGIAAAAALSTSVISLTKRVSPWLDANFSGAVMAFIFTALVYAIGFVVAGRPVTPDGALLWIVSWVTCATAAVGVHSAATHTATNIVELRQPEPVKPTP